ncbi:hypothetical protein [Bradyrhizobium sp. AUGA SZCCT0160]|uniref:hypothetical protein n=1 Tax=Bradyrhizobium sp. AUGA SZCCT0160 TaxID=2807662 RepID=UPI001BAB3C78|nr:hypothetical protein [Bradyrhizobium sp. AUGA SZCCT0160]MBR1189706.1 hypothetical protein [Bradyrhizobium sp. AUGA SZCCT0160]
MIVRRNIARAGQKKFLGADGGFVLRLDGPAGSPQPAQTRLIDPVGQIIQQETAHGSTRKGDHR